MRSNFLVGGSVAASGFRPFFLLAGGSGLLLMAVWAVVYQFHAPLFLHSFSHIGWHAHEMVFGYGAAVLAGFLLTAARTWTGLPTLTGYPLLLTALCWLLARVLPLVPDVPVAWISLFDLGFYFLLLIGVGRPLLRVMQWRNLGVLGLVLLIMLSNMLYYLGLMEIFRNGIHLGLYSGFYLLIGLVLVMCRRLIPLFTMSGIGYPVQLKNSPLLDSAALPLFLAFWAAELLWPGQPAGAWLAGLLAILHGVRWGWWHRRGIWKKPLLWVLFLAYGFLILGFLLRFAAGFAALSPFLVLHAFAVGGVGLISMGMMARVSLGHTGREVHNPPPMLGWLFGLLTMAGVTRVVPPLIWMQHYPLWVAISQWLWIIAFAGFLWLYAPMLWDARVDGRPG